MKKKMMKKIKKKNLLKNNLRLPVSVKVLASNKLQLVMKKIPVREKFMNKWVPTVAAAILACFAPNPGQQELRAENPLLALLPFRIIDADPTKSYTLTPENGPWVIVASSFVGDGAEQQARELVFELRKRYKLEAFTHRRTYDFSKTVVGRGINQYGEARRMRHAHDARFDEIAV